MKKKAECRRAGMETIQEDPVEGESEEDEIEEEEERALEEALLEVEFMDNVMAATENT